MMLIEYMLHKYIRVRFQFIPRFHHLSLILLLFQNILELETAATENKSETANALELVEEKKKIEVNFVDVESCTSYSNVSYTFYLNDTNV